MRSTVLELTDDNQCEIGVLLEAFVQIVDKETDSVVCEGKIRGYDARKWYLVENSVPRDEQRFKAYMNLLTGM